MTRFSRLVITLSILFSQLAFISVKPALAASATYYFSPSTVDVTVGQSRTVTLYVSSNSQSINSGSGTIVLPTSLVSGISVSKAGSIFTLWTTEPSVSGSTVRFGGGLSSPGYKGGSGKILSFTVRGGAEGTGLVTLNSGKILANDGKGTDIFSGSPSATVEVTRVVSGSAIASESHPNQDKWYNQNNVKLSWSQPSDLDSYSYTFSSPGNPSLSKSSTAETSALFEGVKDGVWTFTLTTNYSDGKSAKSSFTVHIDTVAPSQPEVKVNTKDDKDQFPVFKIDSTDKTSGIDHYEISIDNKDPLKTDEKTYKLPKQLPGNHSYSVIAVDKAGNKSTATIGKFFIEGVQGPKITDSPTFVAMLQPMKLAGLALYGSVVQIYVDDKQVGEFYVSEYLSDRQERKSDGYNADEEVEWTYSLKNDFSSGSHQIYATQTTSLGYDSFKSNTVNTRVLSGWVSLGGIIIPVAVLFWILLILTALLILLLVFIWKKYILSWKGNLSSLQQQVDSEMDELIEESPAESEEIKETKGNIDDKFKRVR